MKTDVSGLKEDVTVLQTGMNGLQRKVSTLQTDVSALKEDVSGLQIAAEEVRSGTNVLIDWAERAAATIKVPLMKLG